MRVAIIVTFVRQKPGANRSTLRQDRSHVPVGIRCGAVVGYTSDSRPARLLTVLKQSRVAVSYIRYTCICGGPTRESSDNKHKLSSFYESKRARI